MSAHCASFIPIWLTLRGWGSLYVVNLDGQGRGVMFEGHHRGPSIGDAENVGMLAASG